MRPATLGDWLGARTPAAPEALTARVREALGAAVGAPAVEAYERCLAAGERLLAELLARGDASRATALDLLAADALVTYAFEAAAEAPASLDARAGEAMRRLSALGATPSPHSSPL